MAWLTGKTPWLGLSARVTTSRLLNRLALPSVTAGLLSRLAQPSVTAGLLSRLVGLQLACLALLTSLLKRLVLRASRTFSTTRGRRVMSGGRSDLACRPVLQITGITRPL